MQDWEWEVANHTRIEEFLVAYQSGQLTDDEKFTLMETMIQSCEELPEDLSESMLWKAVLRTLDRNIPLHIHSVWYWADLENDNENETWRVTPDLRLLLEQHRKNFA